MSGSTEYTLERQKLFIELLASDQSLMERCLDIIKADYFDSPLRDPARVLIDHMGKYGEVPSIKIMNSAATGKDSIKQFETHDDEFVSEHTAWFMDEFEEFCRLKGMEIAIVASADKLDAHEGIGEIESLVKSASEIGIAKNMGYEHFVDNLERLQSIRDEGDRTPMGWQAMDHTLHGGVHRGELNIFAGASGSGKSLFLQNLALNWVFMGFNVVYVSLELSENLCSLRFDSMVTGIAMSKIIKDIDEASSKITASLRGKRRGRLRVVKMPSGSNSNSIRAFMKECQIRDEMKIDAVIVDYMGLMEPSRNVSNSRDNAFNNDKYVSEELRDLAFDWNILFATASQLNRESVNADELNHSHIAGGISKINTADNVFFIQNKAVDEESETGVYTIRFAKTRSSSGEGKYVQLDYGPVSLRISDLPDGKGVIDENEAVANTYANKVKSMKDNSFTRKNTSDSAADYSGDDSKKKLSKWASITS